MSNSDNHLAGNLTGTSDVIMELYVTLVDVWEIAEDQACALLRLKPGDLSLISNKSMQFDSDQLERAGYLLSIDAILSDIFTGDQKRTWLRSRDTTTNFGGNTVLEKLMSGRVRDLYDVEAWLKGRIDLL